MFNNSRTSVVRPGRVPNHGCADPLFHFALLMTFAESTVVSAVDTRSPHDGFSREGSSSVMDAVCTWLTFTCNGISGMTRPTSRQGRFNASDKADAIQNVWLSTLSLVSQLCSAGAQEVMPADRSKISPVISILCIITDSLRATATAARLKPTFSLSFIPQARSELSA